MSPRSRRAAAPHRIIYQARYSDGGPALVLYEEPSAGHFARAQDRAAGVPGRGPLLAIDPIGIVERDDIGRELVKYDDGTTSAVVDNRVTS